MKRALLIMAKRPFPGRTKTRLSPPFSHADAAALYECFLQDTVEMVSAVPESTPFIAFTPTSEEAYFRQMAPDFGLVPQIGRSLNERLDYVMRCCSKEKFDQVVATSSDSPSLPVAYLKKAFAHLDERQIDVVIGPSEDGGYYLIGWKRPNHRLIREVRMSTATVMQDTLDIAQEEGLKVALLPLWYDVDGIQDLKRLSVDLDASPDIGQHTRRFLRKANASEERSISFKIGNNSRSRSKLWRQE